MKKIAKLFVALSIVASMFVGSVYAESGVNTRLETDGEYCPIQRNSQVAHQAMAKIQHGVNLATDNFRLQNISRVVKGTIVGWPESGFVFQFDDYVSVVSDIQAWWSINQLNPDRGWFYGYNSSTDVAHITGITNICEITDASIYTYDDWSVGPVDEGDFVLFHNVNTGYYAAFRIDDIYGPDLPSALADVTWYLQEDGSPNFGPCASLTISPPSGDYVRTQRFDLTLIVEAPGLSVTGGSATLDSSDVTSALASCVIPGTLTSGGQTFRCPGITGGFLGAGTHTLSVTLNLSNASSVSDTAAWKVKENTEP